MSPVLPALLPREAPQGCPARSLAVRTHVVKGPFLGPNSGRYTGVHTEEGWREAVAGAGGSLSSTLSRDCKVRNRSVSGGFFRRGGWGGWMELSQLSGPWQVHGGGRPTGVEDRR